jgi:hypothetical protein
MKTPVVRDTLNNIQMILKTPEGNFNVQYGKENFAIVSLLEIAAANLSMPRWLMNSTDFTSEL